MNFEDLQHSWKNQPVKDPGDTDQLKLAMETSWNKHQRKVLRTNLFLSICFLMTCVGLAFIYFSYRAHFGWAFQLSMLFIYILMFIFLAVSWKSYGFRKENRAQNSTSYICYQLKKLQWQRKTITVYGRVYVFLLWIDFMCYSWEVTSGGSALFRFSAMAVITFYIIVLMIWQRLTQQKKALKSIDELTSDFSQLKNKLEN